jgi:aspartyl-tRNA(Asn)/glutamyl-tRNA(Gln) amidotransferase subunit A
VSGNQLAFSDATTLGRLIARREISSVELTKMYLERLEAYGPALGAVVTVMPERALREARKADAELRAGTRRSPLHGVPYGVKDLLAAVGAPTTWGATPFRNQVFDYDATVVRKLHAAGCVLLVKLAMVELAGGFGYNDADASFTGPGRTPWNRAFWSGGSSSGPGAASAAGLVGFAIGSETDGSILVPAAFCGVSGLRPTYGRVSRHGAMALMWTSDKLGPICRSARDTAAVLKIIAGADANDSSAQAMPFRRSDKRPKIGVLKNATKKTMPAVVQNFKRSLDHLHEFADVVYDVTLPDYPYGAIFAALFNGECSSAFRELIESGGARQLRSVDDKIGCYAQYATLAVDYIDASRLRAKANTAVHGTMTRYDALVYPTLPTVAYPVGKPFDQVYTNYPGALNVSEASNLAGIPAMSIPNGFGENGLPTGLGMVGRAWAETALTDIASVYQTRTDFHTRTPTV